MKIAAAILWLLSAGPPVQLSGFDCVAGDEKLSNYVMKKAPACGTLPAVAMV